MTEKVHLVNRFLMVRRGNKIPTLPVKKSLRDWSAENPQRFVLDVARCKSQPTGRQSSRPVRSETEDFLTGSGAILSPRRLVKYLKLE